MRCRGFALCASSGTSVIGMVRWLARAFVSVMVLASTSQAQPFTDGGCGYSIHDPVVDLTVVGIEVTQGSQCFDPSTGDTECEDNSVPLLAGRPTAVRVYVAADLTPKEEVQNVLALLFVRREGEAEPGRALLPGNGPIRWRWPARDTLDDKRRVTDGTLNFLLPEEWLTGRVILRAFVNPLSACGPRESDLSNNWSSDLVVEFEGQECPLTIGYLPVEYEGRGPHGRVNGAWEWLYRVWPTGDPPEYQRLPSRLPVDYNPVRRPARLIADLNDLYAAHLLALLFGGPLPPRILFGWVPHIDSSSTRGHADPPWDENVNGFSFVAWSLDTGEWFEQLLAHESAHNFDQHHAQAVAEPPWPYLTNRIQEAGFDVARLEVMFEDAGGEELRDMMGTGLETSRFWISPHTYKNILAGRPYGPWCPVASAAGSRVPHSGDPNTLEYALIRGEIPLQGGGSLGPVFHVSSTTPPPIPILEGSDYCVEFLGPDDSLLASRCFDASFENFEEIEGDGMLDEAFFFLLDIFPPETTSIRLVDASSQVLDERVKSPSKPKIQVLVPNGGESLKGVQTVVWQAWDADGDALTFSIFYSPDGGQSWRLVDGDPSPSPEILADEQGAPDTFRFSWDTEGYGGGKNVRIRVVANDGFHTVFDESDDSFEIALKGPEAEIAGSINGSTYRGFGDVFLLGRGFDLEDGELRNELLEWWSDREGFLGSGNHVSGIQLQPGPHTITLTAVDADGFTGSAQAQIFVQPPKGPFSGLLKTWLRKLDRCLLRQRCSGKSLLEEPF